VLNPAIRGKNGSKRRLLVDEKPMVLGGTEPA
jgi:hypothetical protein